MAEKQTGVHAEAANDHEIGEVHGADLIPPHVVSDGNEWESIAPNTLPEAWANQGSNVTAAN